VRFWFLLLLIVCACGCGGFAARRIAQAPNSYPKWLAPKAPVTLAFSGKLLSAFTNGSIEVASPPARIHYRIIEPGDYQFRWTNRLDEARGELDLSFGANVTNGYERTNAVDARGTVILLHGYGVSGLAMLPWAFLLAEEGWRCVLVDLRGHGQSTSKRVYFGTEELNDLRALLTHLEENHDVSVPVQVVGHSFGGVLALRWKMADPRVDRVVSMSPYADLPTAIENIRREYARWIPKFFIAAGARHLPELLQTEPCELNPSCWVNESLSDVLFVAGGADAIATLDQVQRLYRLAGAEKELMIIKNAAHETLPFYLDDLAEPVTRWLRESPVGQILPAENEAAHIE
jgi:alpha-beta hydrolase superfamily lysophospholipase